MSDERRMTRSDWYLLGPSRTPGSNTAGSPSSAGAGLRPIAQPVNHDGLDLSQLPPMREAMLSADQINQLFRDLNEHASDILLMRRTAQSPRAQAAPAATPNDLQLACDAVLSGQVPRVQIRYKFAGADWIDTVERQESSFRLVRIVHTARTHG